MKGTYQIVDRKDSRALAAFLSGEGQLLLPMLELIEQAEMAVDEPMVARGGARYSVKAFSVPCTQLLDVMVRLTRRPCTTIRLVTMDVLAVRLASMAAMSSLAVGTRSYWAANAVTKISTMTKRVVTPDIFFIPLSPSAT